MKRVKIENSGLQALQLLRKSKHKKGFPFMINSSDLPDNQCFMEYPNGTIQIVAMNKSKKDFEVIRTLSEKEQKKIKTEFLTF